MEKKETIEKNSFDKIIYSSDDWLILRKDKDGVHMHINNDDSTALICLLMVYDSELWESLLLFMKKFEK